MAVMEALLALILANGGDAVKTRIKEYESLRATHKAYWAAPKKH
jgi:hypothetical protein